MGSAVVRDNFDASIHSDETKRPFQNDSFLTLVIGNRGYALPRNRGQGHDAVGGTVVPFYAFLPQSLQAQNATR
jgi:hypothetical protein